MTGVSNLHHALEVCVTNFFRTHWDSIFFQQILLHKLIWAAGAFCSLKELRSQTHVSNSLVLSPCSLNFMSFVFFCTHWLPVENNSTLQPQRNRKARFGTGKVKHFQEVWSYCAALITNTANYLNKISPAVISYLTEPITFLAHYCFPLFVTSSGLSLPAEINITFD